MNDWLSDIELEMEWPPNSEDIDRMARVLRELAVYLRDICELKHISLPDASDDAKELLK